MRTLAHLSDLHFGAEDRRLAHLLAKDLELANPDVIAVSGDVTQRARSREFAAAREWIESLPGAKVVVPGNHDVPLWNLLRRTVRPFEAWRRAFGEPEPLWEDDAMLVIGVNTARSLTISAGRIDDEQVGRVRRRLEADSSRRVRVIVAHHPFVEAHHRIVGRGHRVMRELAEAGLDLVLAGHHHAAFTGSLGDWHVGLASSMLVSHASTALSHRRREEHDNGWTRIDVEPERIAFQVREPAGDGFVTAKSAYFRREARGWTHSG